MNQLEVVVADSNELITSGLRVVLSKENHIEFVGEAHNESELLELLSNNRVDIVMIDFTARNFKVASIPVVLESYPEVQVIAVTPDQDAKTIVSALRAGVTSYVKKDCSLDEIVDSIRDTAEGNRFFCSQILRVINEGDIDPDSEEIDSSSCDPVKLSDREQEVIGLIAQGFTNSEMADKLFLSPHTVNTHRKNIMQKLGVKNTASIVMYAVKANLVDVK